MCCETMASNLIVNVIVHYQSTILYYQFYRLGTKRITQKAQACKGALPNPQGILINKWDIANLEQKKSSATYGYRTSD